MFTFTPLLGAQTQSQAVQSILEFDGGVKILVDVGWDESFDAERLRELEKQVPTLSLILLTHATVSHLGAYAHCCKHVPLFDRIPVYATTPVISLGRTLLQDVYASSTAAASLLPATAIVESTYLPQTKADEQSYILLAPPTPEEIVGYFQSIHPLRYSQEHEPLSSPFSPALDGLTITAYCAGYTLGGTIWHIQSGSDSVVYAVDWNQGRENALPGAAWLGTSGSTSAQIIEQLRSPTALICSSKGAAFVAQPGGRKQRDDDILNRIREATTAGGNVLLPCDSGARALELAYLLETACSKGELSTEFSQQPLSVYFASRTAGATIKFAKSMLEWMDEGIVKEFEAAASRPLHEQQNSAKATQPFDFKFVKLLDRPSQVERALTARGPKVFLASDSSLEWGFARRLLKFFASDSNNVVLFSGKPHVEKFVDDSRLSVSSQLWEKLISNTSDNTTDSGKPFRDYQCHGEVIHLQDISTAPLGVNEVPLYQQYLARQRQRQNAFTGDTRLGLEATDDVVEDRSDSSSSSDEDSDNEQQGRALVVSAALTRTKDKLGLTDEDLGINVLLRRKEVHDFDVRGRRGREKMFPFATKRRRNDEFGDVIRPEDYLRAEERDEVDGNEMPGMKSDPNTALGLKRKWDDGVAQAGAKRNGSVSKRPRNQNSSGAEAEDHNKVEESEESDYEPDEAVVRAPTKATFTEEVLNLNLKLAAVDFSGLHDKRSLQMLIPLIKPRKLILTGGNAKDTKALFTDCEQVFGAAETNSGKKISDVFMPVDGETVDASVDTNAWTINLSRTLLSSLHWQKFRGLDLVTINGMLQENTIAEQESMKKRPRLDTEDAEAEESRTQAAKGVPVLTTLMAGAAISSRGSTHQLHVGDLRLAELRNILQSTGHRAEFKGEGTLLVDDIIAVRKSGIGNIEVECSSQPSHGRVTGPSFADVKKKIYDGLALVAAN